MTGSMLPQERTTWRYSSDFANSLVDNFGLDGAIQACRRHGWNEPLTVLLVRKYAEAAVAAPTPAPTPAPAPAPAPSLARRDGGALHAVNAVVLALMIAAGGWLSDSEIGGRSAVAATADPAATYRPANLPPRRNWDAREIDCLARNIYWEAGYESVRGRELVAHITMNRVDDRRFPDTICGVVMQPRAFSWTIRSSAHPSFRGPNAKPPRNRQWFEALALARKVAEREHWWRLAERVRRAEARRRRTATTGDLLARVRGAAWQQAAGYGRGDIAAAPQGSQRLLPREKVEGLHWYLNEKLVHRKRLEAWRKRLVPVMAVGGHLFFADKPTPGDGDA